MRIYAKTRKIRQRASRRHTDDTRDGSATIATGAYNCLVYKLSCYRLTPECTQNRIRRSIRRIYATLFGGVRSQCLTPAQNGIREGVATSPACESSTHRL